MRAWIRMVVMERGKWVLMGREEENKQDRSWEGMRAFSSRLLGFWPRWTLVSCAGTGNAGR